MRGILLLCLLLAVLGAAQAAEVTKLDDFKYADDQALRAAWAPMFPAAPVSLWVGQGPGGSNAMKLSCPFTQEGIQRGSADRQGNVNLLRAGAITFDFYVDNPAPIAYCSLYFHSGDGWYGHSFSFSKGWQHVVLSKGSFNIEDQPAGWDKVDSIRISAWNGKAQDTFCAFANLEARTEDIAIVRGLGAPSENRYMGQAAEQISDYLDRLGLPHGALTDSDVENGALAGTRLALFAYNPRLSDTAVTQIADYIAGGGKVLFFYQLPDKLRPLLGVKALQWQQKKDDCFAKVVFQTDAVMGLPATMGQDSWNANIITVEEGKGQVIGNWQDLQGKVTGPAAVLSANGLYLGHVLTDADPAAKQEFLMAILGHFLPEAWETAANSALGHAVQIGPFSDRVELEKYLATFPATGAAATKIKAGLQAATAAQQRAADLKAQKRYPEAMAAAAEIGRALSTAYCVAHTPRTAEFRAVWNHSGTGDCGTWEDAMQALKAGGFNAVVPNMWWGGLAYYHSKLLPVAPWVAEKGDQIEQCVAAGKKYGIEVHPWKVNWNLSNAPKSFVDQMRAEGRLQATAKGDEAPWLCPSDPRNYQLELDTMLEVVRNYDVDGVHFDYIRYPGGDNCYCNGCRQRFEAQRGAPVANWPADCYSGPLRAEYRQWRCDNITRLVKAVSEQARALKPWIKISAAVFSDYPRCKDDVGQDWVLWCREGYLDFVCPMNYTDSDTRLQNLVANQVSRVGGAVPLYSGIGAFIIPDEQAIGQVELARANGADGFILFNMGNTLARQGFPKFAEGITSAPAILPHDGPVVRFRTALDAAEELIVVKEGSLKVTVELTSLGQHRPVATAATGKIELQDMTGKPLAALGDLPKVGGQAEVTVPAQAGPVRVAAVGTLKLQDGTSRPFVCRSRPYSFAGK